MSTWLQGYVISIKLSGQMIYNNPVIKFKYETAA